MTYLLTFMEGIMSFISPCMLPLLPLYVSYFAGGEHEREKTVIPQAISFVMGFTVLFVLLGVFAGSLGRVLIEYQRWVQIIAGALVVILGLNYLGILKLSIFRGMEQAHSADTVPSAFLFGLIYSLSLTPCVGAFLGSALLLASQEASAGQGALLLFTYSMGLGVPFVLSALLLDRLKGAFDWIKRHFDVIQKISGGFLVVLGILMMTGLLNSWLRALS